MTAPLPSQVCPVCAYALTPGIPECPNCHTDCRLFVSSADTALDFYNDALDLIGAGDREAALEKIRGALAADPALVDAYIVAGKLLAQSGRPAELEQAIAYWTRARSCRPDQDQASKLDQCIEAAEGRLRRLGRQQRARRRNIFGSLVVGSLALVGAGVVAGFLLHSFPRRPVAGDGARQDAALAIQQAIGRPDIRVERAGSRLMISGQVDSKAEKQLVHSAAAYAAGPAANAIDDSALRVAPYLQPVGSPQVERLLHLLSRSFGRSPEAPLYGADLTVTGGNQGEPIKVAGTVSHPQAGAEIMRAIKEVYPSANHVDVSALQVKSPARIAENPALVRQGMRQQQGPQMDENPNVRRGSARTYTVQPGDTMFLIARKYGHNGSEWPALWEANKASLKSPHALAAGVVLRLPRRWQSGGPEDRKGE